jgi:hypothetical protein
VTRHREALFSMSAFNGVLAIRRYSAEHPDTSLPEVVKALRRVSPDDAYHNYDAALVLHDWIEKTERQPADIPAFFRETLTVAIREVKPWWLRLSPFGRDRVRAVLSSNEEQCLAAAGLFSEEPSLEIRNWWDGLGQGIRSETDSKHLAQGRAAEQLTIQYEIRRLSELGISHRPRWVALDDNTAGYDVHSFDSGPFEPVAKLIEVKSCARESWEIFLTRKEWETAVERSPNYRFHIWILPEKRLIELTPDDLKFHIPLDRGNGHWQISRIALPSS